MRQSALEDYPGLGRWREKQQNTPTSALGPAERLVLKTCDALAKHRVESVRTLSDGFLEFLRVSSTPLADFLVAETIIQNCDADLLEILSEIGEEAVRAGAAEPFFHAMQASADGTGLVALRFLAAWTALNNGEREKCVEECEKVDQPYAALHTIHGQALIELVRPQEAVEALTLAVRLAPNEVLAWFQLAKAHHIQGDVESAWRALLECQRLAPQSAEVALFMALVALDENVADVAIAKRAWQELRAHLAAFRGSPDVVFHLVLLAIKRNASADAAHVIADANWERLRGDQKDLTRHLPAVLRGFHALGWHAIARDLLTHVTIEKVG